MPLKISILIMWLPPLLIYAFCKNLLKFTFLIFAQLCDGASWLQSAFSIRKCDYIFLFSWFCHNCFKMSKRCAQKNFMIMFPQFRTCAVAMTCLFGIIETIFTKTKCQIYLFKWLFLHLVLKWSKTQEKHIQLWYGCVLEPRMGH